MKMRILENEKEKRLYSEVYNYYLNKETGYFARWGKDKDDDPLFSPFGPEIWDAEISTSVQKEDIDKYPEDRIIYDEGCLGCSMCYKLNGRNLPTYNMTFEEFKNIFDKMPKTVISVAFGIMNYTTNPDFIKMAKYLKSKGVAPTFTMHGKDKITKERVKEIVDNFSALAISCYDKDKSYNWIKALTDAGMKQVSIHAYLSQETLSKCYEILNDTKTDERLSKLHACVLLGNKRKGNALKNDYHCVSEKDYNDLVSYVIDNNIKVGFDSCTANRYIRAVKEYGDEELYNKVLPMVEPCESFGMFSCYTSATGKYYPCSFCEGEGDWKEGIDLNNCTNFLKEVWNDPQLCKDRKKSLSCSRNCLYFKV